jgi:hypothetical protein
MSDTVTSAMLAHRCAISAGDCEEAGAYLRVYLVIGEGNADLNETSLFICREALLIAAIVSYSRAFTDSRGKQSAASRVKVDLGKVFDNDFSKTELHKRVLDRRHRAVAHSDWVCRNTQLLEANRLKGALRRKSVVDYGEGIDIKMFTKIADIMCDHFRHQAYDRDVGWDDE